MKPVAKSLLHLEFLYGDCDSRLKQPQELLFKPLSSSPPTPRQAKSKMREKKGISPLYRAATGQGAIFCVVAANIRKHRDMRFLEKSRFFLGEISLARKNRDFSRCCRKIDNVFHTGLQGNRWIQGDLRSWINDNDRGCIAGGFEG
jgi:hypothetical protein